MDATFWNYQVSLIKAMRPPMRPHPSEIAAMREMVIQRTNNWPEDLPINVLVLGLTPEIVEMDWPRGARITAVDRSEGMIRAFWSGDGAGQKRLVRADWMDMSFEPQSFHFAFGDGVFNTVGYPEESRRLADAVSRVIKHDGLFIIRFLSQAEPRESEREIVEAYRAGVIDDYHEFRFRMQSAGQESVEAGLMTSKEAIDRTMQAHGVCLAELYDRTGYQPPPAPPEPLAPSASQFRVTFPTLPELTAAVAHRFRLIESRTGNHPLAYRCPILALEPNAQHGSAIRSY